MTASTVVTGATPAGGKSLVAQTAAIVSSFVSFNRIDPKEVPGLVQSVHGALSGLSGSAATSATERTPAIPVKKSVTDEYIICLEDGKKLTMMKRYLRTHFSMSPEEYRRKWDLPHDYPMVAPAYARLRSAFAKKAGLGHKGNPGRGQKKKT